jgi:hypothetical protein
MAELPWSGRKGLSNDFSRIVPNFKPIYGVAILMGNPPGDLLVLSVRMPDEFPSLLPMVMKDIEEHRGQKLRRCQEEPGKFQRILQHNAVGGSHMSDAN